MLKPIIFWGATGQAKVLREFISDAGYDLVALFDNSPEVPPPFADVALYRGVAGFEAWRASYGGDAASFLVAIGGAHGRARLELQRMLEGHGLLPATVAHPSAFVARDVVVGAGSQILAKAAICAEVSVGKGCIINTAASVDHECALGDGVHIGPGATLAGCISVGARAFVGAGAVILPRLSIGSDAIIGAGAVVTRSLPDGVVAYGNPARVVRVNPDVS